MFFIMMPVVGEEATLLRSCHFDPKDREYADARETKTYYRVTRSNQG